MNKEIEDQLDNVFVDYRQRFQDSEEMLKAKHLKNEFLQLFEILGRITIVPAMVEIGKLLESYGHKCDIGKSFEEKAIFMNIFPNGKNQYSHPSIAFMADESNQKIGVHIKSFMPGADGGKENYLGDFLIEDITSDFVERKIVNLIQESFSNVNN